jgi:hypothetical protein
VVVAQVGVVAPANLEEVQVVDPQTEQVLVQEHQAKVIMHTQARQAVVVVIIVVAVVEEQAAQHQVRMAEVQQATTIVEHQ